MNDLVYDLEKQAQAGIAAHEAGRMDEAKSILETVLTIDGSHVAALQALGKLHLNAGEYSVAELLVLKALLFGGPQPALLPGPTFAPSASSLTAGASFLAHRHA